jgi:hypothetical protein
MGLPDLFRSVSNIDQSIPPVDNGDGTVTVTHTDGTKSTLTKGDRTGLGASLTDTASGIKSGVQNFIQGPPPVNPANTPAGKTAQDVTNTAIDRSNNFVPTAAPQAGRDPAAQKALDDAQAALAAYQNPPPGAPPALPPPGMTPQQYLAQLQQAVSTAQAKLDTSIDPRLLVGAPPQVTATTINPTPIGPAPQTTAAQVDPNSLPTVSGGNYSYNPYMINPGSIPDAVAGSAGGASVTAKMIDPTGLQINPGDVPDIDISGSVGRQAQLKALGLAQTAAEGNAPSAAQILLQQGIDSGVGSAYGLAASTQGRNPGEALRQGVTSAADLTLKGAAQSAALRATEMADARGLFGTIASQIAAGDIQVAQSNQTKNLQVAITNLNDKIDILKANQQADLQAGIATASNATAASIANLQAQTQVSIANLNKSVAIDIANQTAANDASKSAAANALAAATTDAVNRVNIISQNLRNAQDANDVNAANQLQVQLEQSRQALAAAQANQTALLDASKTNATNQTNNNQFNAGAIRTVDLANQDAGLTQQQINNSMQLGLSGQAFNAAALGLQTQAQYAAAKAAYDAGFAQFIASAGKTIASSGTAPPVLPPPTSTPITYGANGSPIIT